MSIVVDGEDGLSFHNIPGKEAVVEAVLFRADDLQQEAQRERTGKVQHVAVIFISHLTKSDKN